MQRGLFVPPFGPLADARVVAELAAAAEEAGWDGFFLWDHVTYREPVTHVADPWICLAAAAVATERVRIGALVTPLARRRPQVLARQATTLDRLSGGRLVLGVGLGLDRSGRELSAFGEEVDDRRRAAMLDEALELITALWSGDVIDHDGPHYQARDVQFLPRPAQQPRIPIWVAARWPHRAPLRRAAVWDGVFPIDVDTPDQLAQQVAQIRKLRTTEAPFDVVAHLDAGHDPAPWGDAGATWALTAVGAANFTLADARALAAAGPP